jgi:hypothetical protein
MMRKAAIQALKELDADVSPSEGEPGGGQLVAGPVEDDHAVDRDGWRAGSEH